MQNSSPLDSELIEAVSRNDEAGVRSALDQGAKANSALWRAAAGGNPEMSRLLLEHGANVNQIYPTTELIDRTNYDETTTGLIAAALYGHAAVVELLLEQGADPNIEGVFSGRTALLAAAIGGHTAIAKRLVEKGADLGARDGYDNSTALDYALDRGHKELAEWLLSVGAQRAPARR